MNMRRLRRQWPLAVSCVLALLVLTETTLRLSLGTLPLLVRSRIRTHPRFSSVAHPYVGHLNKAGSDTDPYGFRNDWPWPATPGIVTLGDSVTLGNGVDQAEAWPAFLGRAFPEEGLVNLALGASGPQQYLRVFETFGVDLRAKLVLIGFFARNDFWDAAKFDAWLRSGAGGNYLVWRDTGAPPTVSLSLRQPAEKLVRSAVWRGELVARTTYVGNALFHTSRHFGSPAASDSPEVYQSPEGERLELQPEDFLSATRRAQPGTHAFRHVLATLARIHSLARENGGRAAVVFVPSKEEVYLPLVGEDCPDSAASLRAALEAVGIPALNLLHEFRRRAAEGEVLFFEDKESPLPNARGHALIAELAIEHLQQHVDRYGLQVRGQ